MRKPINKIFEDVSKAPSVEAQIQVLHANFSQVLASVLKHMFDERIVFLLPDEPLPKEFIDTLDPDNHFGLYNEARKFYLLVQGHSPIKGETRTEKAKVERIFIDMMSSITKEDANILQHMVLHKSPYPNIDAELIEKAFPGLLAQ